MPRGLLLMLLVACDVAVEPDRTVEESGIHAVGTRRLDIGRTVAIETLEIDRLRPREQALLAAVTTWKLEVADAGHWSVSAPGCGPGKRQTDGEDVTYLVPVTVARSRRPT